MSNSPLVNYVKLSPHCNSPRRAKIDTITIHHMAGNLSAQTCGQVFQTRQASANYGVDSQGHVGLYVDEGDRSWASSNPDNDHRAVTIEVANCGGAPDWPVSGKAYDKLIQLVADICRRNGIPKLVWSDSKADRVGHKNGCNMTVHQDFMATACPGPYLLRKMPDIARDVNQALGQSDAGGRSVPYTVRVDRAGLPIWSGPGEEYSRYGTAPAGVYTVVEERGGWGRLKSGAGWVRLDQTRKA